MLQIRPANSAERPLVLSTWKHDLFRQREDRRWGKFLRPADFWLLINYVIDEITFPSSEVWMGVHPDRPEIPLCWAAVRNNKILHMHARNSVLEDPELAAVLQHELTAKWPSAIVVQLNPFRELSKEITR